MGEEAEDDLYRAEVYDGILGYDDDSEEVEYDCPIHGRCGGDDGECPRC